MPRYVHSCGSTPHPLNSQFSRALQELQLRDAFRAGERIPAFSLAEWPGVLRTVLRLAIHRLAHKGIVEASREGTDHAL